MPEPISKIIDSLAKLIGVLSPRVSVTVFVTTAALFLVTGFLPGKMPQLDAFVRDHMALLTIACIAFGVVSLTYPVAHGWSLWKRSRPQAMRRKRLQQRLQSLSLREKHILQEHLEDDVKTVSWSVNRLEIASLTYDGVLLKINQIGTIGHFTIRLRFGGICVLIES